MNLRPAERGRSRLSVYVFAHDPLLHAGAMLHLSQEAGWQLVDEDGIDQETVIVVVSDTFDGHVARAVMRPIRRGARGAVLIVDELDPSGLVEAVRCGIDAILWRQEATAEVLRRAVTAVWSGGGRLPPDLLGHLLGAVRHKCISASTQPRHTLGGLLTERETEVLRLVADGYGTLEIAARLSYSERTIKTILHGVTARLHLRNRTHAVAYLIRHGIL